jgi:sucrose phosphorylase
VGALAGRNDVDLLQRTGVGRDINRHHYSAEEIASELERPVVRALMALCAFRSTLPVFDGEFAFALEDGVLTMSWRAGEDEAQLSVDLLSHRAGLWWRHGGAEGSTDDLVADPPRV